MKRLSVLFVSIIALAASTFASTTALTVDISDIAIRLDFYTPSTVRVLKYPKGASFAKDSYAVIASPQAVSVSTKESANKTTVSSDKITVVIDKTTGLLSFSTKSGKPLIKENRIPEFTPIKDLGQDTYTVGQSFLISKDEAIYGLGNHSTESLSKRGFSRRLLPGNVEDGIPVFQSSKGYGIYWDNYSPTLFSESSDILSFTSEVGDCIDYYFMYGGDNDGVIAEIREISGDVPMLPLWTYGFWQSRERYKTQQEPVEVVRRYRELGIPIDGIIQDWQYWGNNYLWNAMEFMNPDFNNPQAMVDDVHGLNAHMIISIWSSFGPHTKPYRELADKGLLFDISTWPQSGISEQWPPRMDYPSGVKVYNPYSKEARDIYWNNLKRLHAFGLDGWWMDSTEPDHFDDNMDFETGAGSFRRVRGAFPLATVEGVYDHQLSADKSKRMFILTRSGWFGQQRTGSNVWTGDVASSWEMLRKQIPAHLNFTMTGNPMVNSDLGGFFCSHYNNSKGKAYDNPQFRELATRWTQLGALTPMMRSHGADSPREVYLFGKAGEPIYDAMVEAIKLRYSLLPYTYSLSWDVSKNRGSFMRALVMDFPSDQNGLDNSREFMFGKYLLVAPVLEAQYTGETVVKIDENSGWDKKEHAGDALTDVDFSESRNWNVYLPKGTKWYDFFSGKEYGGGQSIEIPTNINTIPLFAKAGAIIPIGPDVNFATEKAWDNLTIKVFPGADGSFTLYEDEGDNYNYEKGMYSTIRFSINKKGRLEIGTREGDFPGMLLTRKFTVRNMATGKDFSVDYDGTAVSLSI